MSQFRLGVCIPPRPQPGEPGFERPEAWGCLREEVQGPLLEGLAARDDIELVSDLDFRRAVIDGGLVMLGDAHLDELDGYFWYCEIDRRPGSYELEVLKALARRIPVWPDPWRWELAVDKYTAHLELRRAGVAVPEFVLFDPRGAPAPQWQPWLEGLLERWGAALLKPRRGAWGKGVTLVRDAGQLRDLVGYIHGTVGGAPDGGFFLERYHDNDLERWASATVLGDEVMYGYRKRAIKTASLGDGRRKVFDADEQGGAADRCDLTEEHKRQALLAAKALGCPIIGFDMIWTDAGPLVVDENTSPGNYPALYEEAGKEIVGELERTVLCSVGGLIGEQ